MPLRVFTDETLIPQGAHHVAMLVPFMGRVDPPESPEWTRFDRYAALGTTLFTPSSLTDCDLAVLPFGWEAVIADRSLEQRAQNFAELVRRARKRLIVFCESDSAEPVPFEGAVVYRTSLYGSTRASNEFALPAWSGDLAEFRAGVPQQTARGSRPTVGFMGLSRPDRRRFLRNAREELSRLAGRATGEPRSWRARTAHATARERALAVLEHSALVDARIVRRLGFAGDSQLPDGSHDWQVLRSAREQFVAHADSCDYMLCVRGSGNFSYRFYEMLCLGRIPAFVDTDCVLPFDDRIDWRAKMISVDVDAIATLPRQIASFHDSRSVADRMDLQLELRSAWERWLSPEGFFARLAEHLADL